MFVAKADAVGDDVHVSSSPRLDSISALILGFGIAQCRIWTRRFPELRTQMSRLVYGWLTWIMAGMPLAFGYALARALAEFHFRCFPSRRHGVMANLAVAMPGSTPHQRRRVARRVMHSYNQMLFEFFRLPHLDREELLETVEVVGREHLEHAVARGRGVILASSHIGNWELAAVVLAHSGYTLHAVAGVQLSRWLTPAIRETKSELAIHTVTREEGFLSLLKALEHNDLVALMVDGDLFHHGISVDFFGRETRWPSGPGVLAQRSGSLIVCGYCERVRPGKFRIVLEPALDPARFSTTSELNAEVAATVERHIREHLDQWCMFRPLWERVPESVPVPSGAAERAEA
jgi:KDO2-lipid IV(A) lauroyltransferase